MPVSCVPDCLMDSSADLTEEGARAVFLHPSGRTRIACYTDNDGYPVCMGDGSMCGYSKVLNEEVCNQYADPV